MIPVALFNNKARLWISGRKNWTKKLEQWQPGESLKFWFHAASLGEFEQGLPLLEEIKKQNPGCKIILTFFSPSGYEIRKHYKHADYVCYLPLDTSYNARKFIDLVKPDAVFFIKYEFWYHYLMQLNSRNIPVYLVSGVFRESQVFFRWYGSWFRKQIRLFRHLFTQDAASLELLNGIGIKNCSVAGDTRFDRVMSIASNTKNLDVAAEFAARGLCIVAGSTWHADEEILCAYINISSPDIKFIIAPHEINLAHVNSLVKHIKKDLAVYSGATVKNVSGKQVLIIDNIGMLSSLYRYGKIAYIGGGFGKGIHNILEAAVFGIPVIFGPNHNKFREAKELITSGGAFSVASFEEFKTVTDRLMASSSLYNKASMMAKEYITAHTGATNRILQHVNNEL